MAHFRPGGKFVVIPQPIEQVPLFARLSQEERELVTARLRRRSVAKGEVVFAAGQPAQALYIISSGWLVLEDSASERTLALANLGAGGLLGEIDTLLGQPYATRARAAANSQLLALSKSDLQDLIRINPSIGLKFSAALGMRIAFLDDYLVRHRLRGLELLSSLSEGDLRAIAANLDLKSFSPGDMIVEAGAAGDAAYIIEEGQARLISESGQGQCFDEIGEGALFGHTALVTGKPSPCTARAISDVAVWVLPRSSYLDLIQHHSAVKIAFSRSLAESLGPTDQAAATEHIRQIPLFLDVPTEALSALVSRLVLRHFPAGELVYTEGTPGDALYVVESGEVKLLDSAFSDARLLERMRAGGSFGEMALLTGRTRAECARATTDSTVWVLYKTDFDELMVKYPEISVSLSRALSERLASHENDFLVRHLKRVDLLSSLAASELNAISNRVKGLRFRPGEIICFAGQPAQTLYMIEMGEVKRIGVGPAGKPVMIDLLGPGDSFGEQSIVQNEPYNATAQAIGQVELWTIAKDDLLAMMEKYPSLAVTITRMMANRLSHAQQMPPPRGVAPMPRGPRGLPPQGRPGMPPRGGSGTSRPTSAPVRSPYPPPDAPVPGARIQRPQSGARAVPKYTPPPPPNPDAPKSPEPQDEKNNAAAVAPPPPRIRHSATAQNTRTASRTRPPAPAASVHEIATEQDVPQPAPARPRPARPPSATRKPIFADLFVWLKGLSPLAKLQIAAVSCLVAWVAFIALPATAITTATSAVQGLQILNPPATRTAVPPTRAATQQSKSDLPLQQTTDSTSQGPKVAYAVPTETPIPTKTRVPTATATRPKPTAIPTVRPTTVPATAVPPTAAPPAAGLMVAPAVAPTVAAAAVVTQTTAPAVVAAAATLAPIYWDPRIGNGPQVLPHLDSVKLEQANVAHGAKFWRAISVKFEDITESGNDHTIYVKVLDENGKRVDGKKAHMVSSGGLSEYPDEKPAGDMCDCNFNYPMYGDGYGFNIEDQYPSDRVYGMIMPMRRHVNYRIIFQLTTMP